MLAVIRHTRIVTARWPNAHFHRITLVKFMATDIVQYIRKDDAQCFYVLNATCWDSYYDANKMHIVQLKTRVWKPCRMKLVKF